MTTFGSFAGISLPNFETKRLVDVDLTALDVFRASLNQIGGLGLKSCRNIHRVHSTPALGHVRSARTVPSSEGRALSRSQARCSTVRYLKGDVSQ